MYENTTDQPLGDVLGQNADELCTSDYYDLLSSAERRSVLSVIADEPLPTDLYGLAVAVAEERATSPGPNPNDIQKLELRLHHVHLPKLADYDVLSYDPETKQIH